ncbi:MAG: Rrf2 family transcriptional regulator [Gammaproteobacteria bacterium]
MRLTTKGRYAVTAILDLALHDGRGPVALADIAARQGISLSYLEQLFSRLRRNGLVASTRGPGGGYSLSHKLDDIAIADVIMAVDEKVDSTACGGTVDCQDNQRCLTHELWAELNDRVHDFLSGISLAELVARETTRAVAQRQDKFLQQHRETGIPLAISVE